MSHAMLLRADASTAIGTGHVMRSLALAQGWQRAGGKAIFAQAESTPALEQRIPGEGIELVRVNCAPGSDGDAAQTVELAREREAGWIVADGYAFGGDWQKQIKDSDLRLLVWDDYGHSERYYSDFILNQNLHADKNLYARRESYTRLLLGPRYVQLRREFLQWHDWQREIPGVAHKILVTLGGSDPDNVTPKIIQALSRFENLETVIVAGGSNPNLSSLQAAIRNLKSAGRLVTNATNMPELMAWADVAVAAAGSTSWELAFMGLPTIVTVLADNQLGVATALDREGVSVNLGKHTQLTAERTAAALQSLVADPVCRERMSRIGRELVDGLGVQRVMTHMLSTSLLLRRARQADCRIVWEWANDPQVREVSFSSEPIVWESHLRWYAAKSRDPNCSFYIATNGDGNPIGQIRFELTERDGVVSVSLARAARGKGYGPALIRRGVDQFFSESSANLIHAYIKPENQTSISSFKKAGFSDAGIADVNEHHAWHMVLEREDI